MKNTFQQNWVLTILSLVMLLSAGIPTASSQPLETGYSEIQYDGTHFYAVADMQYRVVKLDREGTVVDQFGNKGSGPGEFKIPNVKLLLVDGRLYMLDNMASKLIEVDTGSFDLIQETYLSGRVLGMVAVDGKINVIYTDMARANPFTSGNVTRFVSPLDGKDIVKESGYSYTLDPISPPYYIEEQATNGSVSISYRINHGSFFIMSETIENVSIPDIEEHSVGFELDKQKLSKMGMAGKLFREAISPSYQLIKSAYLTEQFVYFHLHSYKQGSSIVRMDLDNKTFERVGSLYNEELIAVDEERIYTLDGNSTHSVRLAQIKHAGQYQITFYLADEFLESDCDECLDGLRAWYDLAAHNHFDIELVFQENGWFAEAKPKPAHLQKLDRMNIWGAMRFEDSCDECFKAPVSVELLPKEGSPIIQLPAPTDPLERLIEELSLSHSDGAN